RWKGRRIDRGRGRDRSRSNPDSESIRRQGSQRPQPAFRSRQARSGDGDGSDRTTTRQRRPGFGKRLHDSRPFVAPGARRNGQVAEEIAATARTMTPHSPGYTGVKTGGRIGRGSLHNTGREETRDPGRDSESLSPA